MEARGGEIWQAQGEAALGRPEAGIGQRARGEVGSHGEDKAGAVFCVDQGQFAGRREER